MRVPKSAIKKDLDRISLENWQRDWETTNKRGLAREHFTEIRERLHTKLTQNFITMVTGHGNIKFSSTGLK